MVPLSGPPAEDGPGGIDPKIRNEVEKIREALISEAAQETIIEAMKENLAKQETQKEWDDFIHYIAIPRLAKEDEGLAYHNISNWSIIILINTTARTSTLGVL